MKRALLRSLLIGSCAIAPIMAFAGGIDVEKPCCTVRVDIPEMREGWGFSVQGAALRGYNNDLNYINVLESTSATTVGGNTFFVNNVDANTVEPNYDFALLLGVDYTFADSANMIKLFYEHLFSTTANGNSYDLIGNEYEGSVKLKLDGVSLLSEQHIIIGPYWEATFSGGLRYARVSQYFNSSLETGSDFPDIPGQDTPSLLGYFTESMQFNGVGPLAGLGGMFHVTPSIKVGAEAQAALLVGKNDANLITNVLTPTLGVLPAYDSVTSNYDANSIYSIVPEMYARIYGNYFYRCADGMELELEAGWRMNQFFNLRTDSFGDSDDIGFSGPYLMGHLKL